MPNISPIHLVIVLIIALIVIGPGKLPEVGAALGKSIKEFRKAASDITDSAHTEAAPITAAHRCSRGSAPVAPAPVALPARLRSRPRRSTLPPRSWRPRLHRLAAPAGLSQHGRPAVRQRVAEPRVRVLVRPSDAGRRTLSDDR